MIIMEIKTRIYGKSRNYRKKKYTMANSSAASAFAHLLRESPDLSRVASVTFCRQERVTTAEGEALVVSRGVYLTPTRYSYTGVEIRQRIAGIPPHLLSASLVRQRFHDCPDLQITEETPFNLDESSAVWFVRMAQTNKTQG